MKCPHCDSDEVILRVKKWVTEEYMLDAIGGVRVDTLRVTETDVRIAEVMCRFCRHAVQYDKEVPYGG